MTAERSGSLMSGEPTPTGQEFKRLVNLYGGDRVPIVAQDGFWRRAAETTGNKEMIEILDRADEEKRKRQGTLRRAIRSLTGF